MKENSIAPSLHRYSIAVQKNDMQHMEFFKTFNFPPRTSLPRTSLPRNHFIQPSRNMSSDGTLDFFHLAPRYLAPRTSLPLYLVPRTSLPRYLLSLKRSTFDDAAAAPLT